MLLILCSIFLISGCKSQKDIAGEVAPLTAEYRKQPILEYFQSFGKSVIVSSSKKIKNTDDYSGEETLSVMGMVLRYYPEDKKAYGKYYIRQYLEKDNKIDEIPVMLDQSGYHVSLEDDLIAEIKDFKFMFEEVSFTTEYLKTLKVKQMDYNFEEPSYSASYLFTNENKDLKKYLEEKNLLEYGTGYSIEFSKKGNYYDGGEVELSIEEDGKAYILEFFNYNIKESEDELDYKSQFLKKETTANE